MARALLRFHKPDTAFWIQDYHFLALGAELRDLGVTQPIGFFLHTPWPARAVIDGVPHHRELVEAMLAYDLIGFQTEDDCDNFLDYLRSPISACEVDDGVVDLAPRHARALAVFPIGIDPREIRRAGRQGGHASGRVAAAAQPERREARDRRRPARLFQGPGQPHQRLRPDVDRCIRSWRARCRCCRSRRRRAARSKPMAICRANSRKLVSDVNGRHGEVDWTPIRYLNKGFSQTVLAGLYRTAQVGVVTPLHDGMNLVAKEYVAAQNPADPGVLVLSKFAGAANELDAALLVNPHDIDGMARDHRDRALDAADRAAHALGSDDGEAARRHHPALVCRFRRRAAGDAGLDKAPVAPIAEPPTLWPLRSANSQRAVSLSAIVSRLQRLRSSMLSRVSGSAFVAIGEPLRTSVSCAFELSSNTTRRRASAQRACSARSDFPAAPRLCPGRRTRPVRRSPKICCR